MRESLKDGRRRKGTLPQIHLQMDRVADGWRNRETREMYGMDRKQGEMKRGGEKGEKKRWIEGSLLRTENEMKESRSLKYG